MQFMFILQISFGQLSMYMANGLRKIPSSGVDSENNVLVYANVDSSLSKVLVILESLLHFTGI